MAGAVARGRALLRAPVSFQPQTRHFRLRLCIMSVTSGFCFAVLIFIAWILTLRHWLMQQQPVRLRPTLAYRPLILLTPTSSFILAGGGQAVLIQHNILPCLFDPTGPTPDIRAFGLCAPAVQLIAQSWRQVDTPSVSSPNFWD